MTETPMYIIEVMQKIMFRKNPHTIKIFDGRAETTYVKEKVAKTTYEMMKTKLPETKLEGNTVIDYFKGKNAKAIFKLYKRDLDLAKTKQGRGVKLDYEVLKGGENGKSI